MAKALMGCGLSQLSCFNSTSDLNAFTERASSHSKSAQDLFSWTQKSHMLIAAAGTATSLMGEHAERIAAQFRLNSDQRSVLHHCSLWAASAKVSVVLYTSLPTVERLPTVARLLI